MSLLQVRAELLHFLICSYRRCNSLVVIHATHGDATDHTLIIDNYIVAIWVLLL